MGPLCGRAQYGKFEHFFALFCKAPVVFYEGVFRVTSCFSAFFKTHFAFFIAD